MNKTVTFPGGRTVTFVNGGKKNSTLKALASLKRKAKGKDRAAIARLEKGLKTNPAARSRRKSTGEKVKKHHTTRHRRAVHASSHAKRHAKVRRNPSRAAIIPFNTPRRRRRPSAGLFGKGRSIAKKLDLKVIALEGVGVAAGALASSAVNAQVANMLPNLTGLARVAASSFLVAAGGYFLGKMQKDLGKGVMVGAIAEFIRSAGHEYAPTVFAGVTPQKTYPSLGPGYAENAGLAGTIGTWDPKTGTFLAGLQRLPSASRERLNGVIWDPSRRALPRIPQAY